MISIVKEYFGAIIRTFFFITCICGAIQTFAQVPIEPILKVSVGNHDHTSRDEITHTLRDNNGNLIIVGLVERDSSFGDIMVQKIDTTGKLIWQYRYSTNYSINYDRPLSTLIDSANNVYVLGAVSNNYDLFSGAGYVIKINKSGRLVWEKNLFFDVPSHNSVSSLFFGFDSLQTLHIAYTADAFTTKPTYFFKVTANDVFLNYQTVPDIFNAGPSQPDIYAFSVSPNGTKNYLLSLNGLYTHQITDTSQTITPIALSDTQKYIMQSSRVDLRGLDKNGNFYILGNKAQNGVQKGFTLFKFLTTGQVGYTFYSTDSIEIEAKDMVVKDSTVLITGRFRHNNGSFWRVFVYEIDKTGRIIQKKFMPSGTADELAEGLYLSMDKLFLTIDYPNGQFSVAELDNTFSKKWAYNFKRIAGQRYDHLNIVSLNNKNVLFNGTLRSYKLLNNFFLSENDFYIQSVNPTDTTKPFWTYRYSDIGTSFVTGIKTISNTKGDILAFHSEQVGPSYPAAGGSYSVGSKSYTTIINSSGQILATRNETISVNQFFTDVDGNFITIGNNINKIDKNGVILNTSGILTPNGTLLFVDKLRNEFYVRAYSSQYIVYKFDKNLNILSTIYPSSPNIRFFQLRNDSTTYSYDIGLTNSSISSISLFANQQLKWKKDTSINYSNLFIAFDVNPKDGSFILCFAQKITKFALNGQISSRLWGGNSDDNMSGVFCMYNGNIILTGSYLGKDVLQAYNADLEYQTRTILKHEFHINYFQVEQFLIRTTDGRVAVFNADAQKIETYTNELLYLVNKENFDKDYNITVGTTIGQDFYLGSGNANQAYGWKWRRGVAAKFSLKNLLIDYITAVSETKQSKNTFDLVAYPNPIVDKITLRMTVPNFQNQRAYNLRIYNTLGQTLENTIWKDINQEKTLDFSNFQTGIYFIEISDKYLSQNSQIIKIVK